MKCIYCGHLDSKVIDSRQSEDGTAIRRRRECNNCGKRYTTYETVETTPILVVKSNGNRQTFDANKLKNGIIKSCEKRPVPMWKIDKLVEDIQKSIYNTLEQEAVQIMPDKKFIQVEAGSNFSFAIDAQRNLWAWGNSGSEGGCLGLGSNIHQQETPEMVKKGVKFVQVEVGYDFVAAIDTEGNFWGWGCNKIGQLGRENSGVHWEPMRFWKNETFSKLAFYKYSSSGIYIANYALNSAGKLYAWFSSLDSVPYTDLGLQLEDKTFIDVETGINHTLAIDSNGKLCVWGFNSHGQLGLGTKGGIVNILNYQVIMPEKQFRFISASMNTSFAIDTEGKLWAWGFNGYGELNGAVGQNFPKKLAL